MRAGKAVLPELIFGNSVLLGMMVSVSICLTLVMIRVNIPDVPNFRSSHSAPTPKSGGLAIAGTFILGFSLVYSSTDVLALSGSQAAALLLLLTALLIFAVFDDIHCLTAPVKLLCQVLVALGFVWFVGGFQTLDLPIVGRIDLGWYAALLAGVWIIAMMNIVNFMDGLNGMASGGVLIGTIIVGVFGMLAQAPLVYFTCFCLFGGAMGFFVFNFPNGKIFMGETGSQFLGFILAALTILASRSEFGGMSMWLIPVVFFTFIFDVCLTASYRLFRGHNLFKAHREHLYQLLHRMGLPQWQVSVIYFATFVFNAMVGYAVYQADPATAPLLAMSMIPIYAVPAVGILSVAQSRGLIVKSRRETLAAGYAAAE